MLSNASLLKARELLQQSQNPLFLFDNDTDGLTSFLLLRRYLNRGKGVPIRSYPGLNTSYMGKINEFKPDMIVVLDKPVIDPEFIQEVLQLGIKFMWIDHHPQQTVIPSEVNFFNPLFENPPSNEPTSYWAYEIAKQKDDIWIAMIGCVGDWYMPYFADDFRKKYPDLLSESAQTPDEGLYGNVLGKIIKILNFALKDRTTNVMKMIRFLLAAQSPHELLEKNAKTRTMHERFEEIDRHYQKLFQKAKSSASSEKLLFFKYSGDLSISTEISNELIYSFPKKVIAVSYVNGGQAKFSFRSRGINIREIVADVIASLQLEGRSGGHDQACAAMLKEEDIDRFIEKLKEKI